MIVCPNCGKSHEDNSNFCNNCGLNLVQYNTVPQANVPPQPQYQQPQYQQPQYQQQFPQHTPVQIVAQRDPTFRATCDKCFCTFDYKINNLGYRAWFPSGFVYCPKCRRPIRHRLEYELR